MKPALLSPERLSTWKIDPASIDTRFLQKYPVPFTLGESEILAIEVAENKRTGQKFVDYYMVTRGAPFLRVDLEKIEQEAREFRAEDAETSVMDFDLRVNGISLQRSPAHDRMRLERLCRYTGRPPLALERLSLLPDGRLYHLVYPCTPPGASDWWKFRKT